MRRYVFRLLAIGMGAALVAPSTFGAPQPTAAAPATAGAADKAAPPAPLEAADLSDPAFDRYIDLRLAGRAKSEQDASLMADAALQLAEGERVLLRTHRSGVTAEQLFGFAAKLASENKDKATLDRLAKAAEARGDQKLVAQIGAARKLAGEARALNPALMLSVESTTPEEFIAYRSFLKDIQSAKLAGDAPHLEQIGKELPNASGLTPERRDYLQNLLKEARDSQPAANADAAKLSRTLDKLALASRDVWSQAVNDTSNDLAAWDQNRLGWGQQPQQSVTTFDDPNNPPPPPPPPHAGILVHFSVANQCSFPVRVQFFPGGQTYTFPAGRVTNNLSRRSTNGEQPSIHILSTGDSYYLENASFQLFQGNDGRVQWSYR